MKSRIVALVLAVSLFPMFFAGQAVAQPEPTAEVAAPAVVIAEPETIAEGFNLSVWVYQQYKAKNLQLAVAGLIMLLVGLWNRFGSKRVSIPEKLLPFMPAIIGVLTAAAGNLAMGMAWGPSLLQGLVAGMAANGAWSMGGKKAPVIGKAATA